MTKEEFEKLSTDEKLVQLNKKIQHVELMSMIKLGIVVLGFLGIAATIENKFKHAIR